MSDELEAAELVAEAEHMLTYKRFGDREVERVFAGLAREVRKAHDAGVTEGIRRAREAVLSKDELYDEGADMWIAVTAIEALGVE